jgi:hypothetical protein
MADRCILKLISNNYVDIFRQSSINVVHPVAGVESNLWAEQEFAVYCCP